MHTSFELTTNDLLEFQKDYYFHLKDYKRNKFINYLYIPFLFSIILIFEFHQPASIIITKLLIFLFISILWILFWYYFYDKMVIKNLKKRIKKSDNSLLLGQHTFTITDQYYTIQNPGSESKVTWESIYTIRENEDYFFIYLTSNSCNLIPKYKLNENKKEIVDFLVKKKGELMKN